MARATHAFVPGHVTVFFSPARHEDPERAGSTGAGLTLTDGVTVAFEPGDETRVTVDGQAVAVEPVDRVLEALSATGHVAVETPLPVGEGFGASGAMTLGAALAANAALGLARSENALVTAAHVAEVEASTGLGDVVAQARGGVPLRLAPGAPGHGALDGVPAAAEVEYRAFGEVDTESVISGDVGAIQAAGERALARVREAPTLETLFAAGRRFAREADLLTPRVETAVEDVLAAGGEATMGMLGETVVALDDGLSAAGYDAERCAVHPSGASLRR